MASAAAAGLTYNSQISRVDKANEFPTLFCKKSVCAFRICACVFPVPCPLGREPRLNVRLSFHTLDLFSIIAGLDCYRVAAMTCGATKTDGVFSVFKFVERFSRTVLVHRFDQTVTRNAAFEFRLSRLCSLSGLLRLVGLQRLNQLARLAGL